jgi:hypothetical protein
MTASKTKPATLLRVWTIVFLFIAMTEFRDEAGRPAVREWARLARRSFLILHRVHGGFLFLNAAGQAASSGDQRPPER